MNHSGIGCRCAGKNRCQRQKQRQTESVPFYIKRHGHYLLNLIASETFLKILKGRHTFEKDFVKS